MAIKAAYGGGGSGHAAWSTRADEAAAAFESASSEALKGFGRGECYVERYLTWPRHVEMQIIGDQHGNCVWVAERDCSAQRRHQKLIEESPAPAFPPEIRQAMGDAAVKVAKACGYYNAGTVEFLFQDGEFWFLEMNTRLQVEHPVTEMVSGIDLVAEQIRVGVGRAAVVHPGRHRAARPRHRGAGQRREPGRGQVPALARTDHQAGAAGRLRHARGTADTSRATRSASSTTTWWASSSSGATIAPTAIARMLRALREFRIEGIATTIPADVAILSHPDFVAATHSTKWVEDTLDLTGVDSAPTPAAGTDDEEPKVKRDVDVEVNGKRYAVSLWVPESAGVGAPAPGAAAAARPRRSGGSGSGAAVGGSGAVAVPMQGTIVKILVEVGQEIEAGQTMCVLEAMKMENNIAADKAGTVTEIKVSAGDSVGSGDVVVIIS